MKSRMHPSDRFPLTDDVIEEVCELVKNGNYITVACAAIGVHRATFNAWKRKGEKVAVHLEMTDQEIDPDEYPRDVLPADVTPEDWQCYKLFWSLETSEAVAESSAVLMIRKAMPTQWTAAMTLLERRFPDRWRKRQTFEAITVDAGGIDEQALIDDPKAQKLIHQALAAVAAGRSEDVIESDAEPIRDAEGIPRLDRALLNPPSDP